MNQQRFGQLTVVKRVESVKGNVMLLCKCDCGTETTIRKSSLKGNTKSCGCLRYESRNLKHGHRVHGEMSDNRTKTYNSWQAMKSRCNNSKASNYCNYGARGIKVCQRWNDSFEAFFEDMGPRPEGKTLDRKDVNKNYCKANCRWATDAEQRANKQCGRVLG